MQKDYLSPIAVSIVLPLILASCGPRRTHYSTTSYHSPSPRNHPPETIYVRPFIAPSRPYHDNHHPQHYGPSIGLPGRGASPSPRAIQDKFRRDYNTLRRQQESHPQPSPRQPQRHSPSRGPSRRR